MTGAEDTAGSRGGDEVGHELGGGEIIPQIEAQHCSERAVHLTLGDFVPRMRPQAGIKHSLHARMPHKPLGQLLRDLALLAHPQFGPRGE